MATEACGTLAAKECKPCRGGVPPLKGEALEKLHKQLGGSWAVVSQHHIEKEFTFRNFRDALEFTNQVGALAEAEHHHPDIYLAWGKAKITLWTHKVDGLTEADFVLAAKIEALQ
jgi:4a-hydroxytetrahydrobiopterin dehydratase